MRKNDQPAHLGNERPSIKLNLRRVTMRPMSETELADVAGASHGGQMSGCDHSIVVTQ